MKRLFWIWLALIVGLEVLSSLVIFYPTANSVLTVAIGLMVFVCTLWRPVETLPILAIEYLIGSKGSLLKFGGDLHNDGGVSLRIVLFAAFIFGWFIWSLKHRTWRAWPALMKERKIYFALAAVLIYAVILGWLRGNHAYFIVDANAWGMWLLLLPALDLAHHERANFWSRLTPTLLAGLVWLPIKTLALDFLFSHQLATINSSVYLWVRRTGVGEVTKIGEYAHRIFLQSQIYAVFSAIFAIAAWAVGQRKQRWIFVILILSFAEIVISLSRSFWIGMAVGLIALTLIVILSRRASGTMMVSGETRRSRGGVVNVSRMVIVTGLAALAALIFVWLVMAFPFPKTDPLAFFKIFTARVQANESAALSRWQLLPVLWNKIRQHPILGSGFGATVTYQSADPRIVSTTGGQYTTYAFEWGWLDHWIKFGLIGIPLMLAVLWSLGWRMWRSGRPDWIRFSVVASLAGLAAIHMFTPYLNHPLGTFALILAEALTIDNVATSPSALTLGTQSDGEIAEQALIRLRSAPYEHSSHKSRQI